MKLLVIGGTIFIGRHIVEAALAAGHEVTLFNRNLSGPGLFPSVEKIVGDRTLDLAALRGRRWDAVVDMCGHQPRDVSAAAELLRERVERYVYISSVMVYKRWGGPAQNEASPQFADEAADVLPDEEAPYRLRRSLCERVVQKALPGRTLVIRPCFTVGPHDPQEALAYWALRAARGGEILAPGAPDRRVQAIDVRDLAAWIVAMISRRAAGVFNACGRGVTMKKLLDACATASRGKGKFVWVGNECLLDKLSPRNDIRDDPHQFLELLPFWIPGVNDRFSTAAAEKMGLTWRPPVDTVRDTLDWLSSRPRGASLSHAFLTPKREAALLTAWRARSRKKSPA